MRKIRGRKSKRPLCLTLALCSLLGTLGSVLLNNLSGTLAAPVTVSSADESSGGAPMALSDIIEATEEADATDIGAGGRLAPATRAGNSYTIDAGDYYGSLTVPGVGYSYNKSTDILTFDTDANGNHYTIIKSGTGMGMLRGIVFAAGVSPASVAMNDLAFLSGGITLPAGFNADHLTFNNINTQATALVLPAGYSGTLEINGLVTNGLTLPPDYTAPITFNGLTTTALTLPPDYNNPLTFNGLTVTDNNGLKYPAGYNSPITISSNFDVNGAHFPAGYSGPITIGGSGGAFTNQQTIYKSGTNIGFDTGICLPGNISTLTINNAKTGGSGRLAIKLGAMENFELLLAGSSDINGYVEVPTNAALTIDSKDATGSESGRLGITYGGQSACIGYNTLGDSGQITINGGTVEATQTCAVNMPAAIGSGAGKTGNVTITGGKVIANGNENGAAIGGGDGARGVGNVTITGGTVIATAGNNGAGIGGGNGAIGGVSGATGATVLITGGTVVATGGDLHNILQGSTNAYGAGIGGGNNGFANVTITGGHVTANSGHGAGIGSGAGGTFGFPGSGEQKGSIEITGGIIRGYTQNGANIGQGFARGYLPTYRIDKEADILMYTRGSLDDAPGVQCAGSNGGDGYFVSVHNFEVLIRGDVYVYGIDANGKTSALDRVLPIPQDKVYYMTFLFSTGHDYPEQFHIFTDYYDPDGVNKGMQQYVHHYDHLPPLPGPSGGSSTHQLRNPVIASITHLNGTAGNPTSYPHNFDDSFANALLVCFGAGHGGGGQVYCRVTEKHVDTDGKPIPDQADTQTVVEAGSDYSKTIPPLSGYAVLGYKWESAPEGPLDYTPGHPSNLPVSADGVIYLVYVVMPPPTGIGLGNAAAALLLPALAALLALGGYAAGAACRRRGQKAR